MAKSQQVICAITGLISVSELRSVMPVKWKLEHMMDLCIAACALLNTWFTLIDGDKD